MDRWLTECEKEWNIDILYACEAGSHAWGTDTEFSDRDVRFIFKHRSIRSYLSLRKEIEVMDYTKPYDAHGWDIFKAMELTAKSNPSIYEWAFSPIIYVDKNHFSKRLRTVIMEKFSPYSLAMHYLSLLKRNINELRKKEMLSEKHQKQVIQALRAILITKYLLRDGIKQSPYFTIKSDVTDVYEQYYFRVVEAKREGNLIQQEKLFYIILQLETEYISLEKRVKQLPKGEPFKEKLDLWLWEILKI